MKKKRGGRFSVGERRREGVMDKEFMKGISGDALKFEVADEIIRIRKAGKLTQAQMGKAIGTDQSAIARIENGSMNPTVLTCTASRARSRNGSSYGSCNIARILPDIFTRPLI
jgi:DNA-binding XRE family transcriptional regulator